MEIIKTQNLSFTYPCQKKPAISDICLTINAGEFITVCGKSGCGKSTLLRQLKPVLSPHGERQGHIYFKGENIFSLSQKEQCSKIGYVLQSPENQIVTDKVWHELAFGLESLSYSKSEIRAKVAEMASFFGISDWFHKKTSELSGGQKQLLNLASVMVADPEVLILDEPTSQLDPIAASDFLETLYKINREIGTTVILSEHRLEDAFPISDRVIVMDDGKIMANALPLEIGTLLSSKKHDMCKALPAPMRVHFAVENDEECPVTVRDGKLWLDKMSRQKTLSDIPSVKNSDTGKETAVSLNEVWFRYEKNEPDVVKGLSLSIKKGEFYAIVGGNGVGKTTTLSIISSALTPYRGKLNVSGKIATLPQNPQVLFVKKTVLEDLSEMLTDSKLLKSEKEARLENIIDICELHDLLHKHPYDLSGGEQQRTALAKVLLASPDILLLDEPTKGLDAHFKEKFAELILNLKSNGITVIAVSHDIEFCAKYADRCGMFFDGKLVSEAAPREFFAGKSFYTTAANRMARNHIPKAVLAEDIISALGGKSEERDTTHTPKRLIWEKPQKYEKKRKKKLSIKRIIYGFLFAICFFLTGLLKKPISEMTNNTIFYIITLIEAMFCLSCFFPRQEIGITISQPEKKKHSMRTVITALMILVTIPLTIFIGVRFLHDKKYYFICLLIILQTMLPFFLIFEKREPKARELIIISVLSAIAVAGRAAFYMLPQFKPVVALVIISGIAFGGEAGFLVGAVTGFVSNFFFSQGPLTPWQMFSFGIIGFLAGVLFRRGIIRKTRVSLCVFGGLATLLIYGGIMNPASVITAQATPTKEMILSSYVLGLPYDLIHAVSTVFFLWLTAAPMIEKLERIKIKYGLIE